jgi:GcrA cell cycle regulator
MTGMPYTGSYRKPTDFDWTTDRVVRLKVLWAEGDTAEAIAGKLGCRSRSAVIGKIFRLKLAPRALRPGRRADAGRPKPPALARKIARKRLVSNGSTFELRTKEEPILPVMDDGADIPLAQRKTLMQLDRLTCRWPFGDPPAKDFFFCGGVVLSHHAYCPYHAGLASAGTVAAYVPRESGFRARHR